MPESSRPSRSTIKSLFSWRRSQNAEVKDDSRSEITLVADQRYKPQRPPEIPRNFNRETLQP
ncbi:hypothetical protein N7499_010273 [Penicillium canescens]|uniref:Uncharacterized protein n=1 Tax=Penicillium canescens TaxID=5083 RepID=A0AAD6NBN8_PENCN|nr:uncharacterized protein N7446_005425 [Penicillium canescens]KAJ5989742.1 hypothetical protein N7522_009949 [Penicillium canescens]KAJ6050335.1 hypothetical protein N7444_007051 [Penicillium canescens]KAJ6050801.1 hypothetical protein N7460_001335 [Penicillium canescens]KAJ6061305.1 hypothetical protein N7446_005425 [Penicillium canescens]KAJ6068386.1 hypothetical protein N7499_010273 [Penicillium canescens]